MNASILPLPQARQKATATHHPVRSLIDAVGEFHDLAAMLGADQFALFSVKRVASATRVIPLLDGNFPATLLLTKTLAAEDDCAIAAHAIHGASPLIWHESAPRLAEMPQWTRRVSPLPHHNRGVVLPILLEDGAKAIVVFAGDGMEFDEAALCAVHARCFPLFADVLALRPAPRENLPAVSKREVECLKLTANGLTSDEIASALGLSVHTANQYLTNTIQKLNAVNRMHAVAKALRSGLIA